MISLSFMWIFMGLMVINYMGINEVMASISVESPYSDKPLDTGNPLIFSFALLMIVILWPLIWWEYLNYRE